MENLTFCTVRGTQGACASEQVLIKFAVYKLTCSANLKQ